MKKVIALSVIAMTMIWAQGMGQGKGRGGIQNRPTFAAYDLNGDGQITLSEFGKAQAARMKQRADEGRQLRNAGNAPSFESLDSNGDNVITPAEFQAHQVGRKGNRKRGSRRGQGPARP